MSFGGTLRSRRHSHLPLGPVRERARCDQFGQRPPVNVGSPEPNSPAQGRRLAGRQSDLEIDDWKNPLLLPGIQGALRQVCRLGECTWGRMPACRAFATWTGAAARIFSQSALSGLQSIASGLTKRCSPSRLACQYAAGQTSQCRFLNIHCLVATDRAADQLASGLKRAALTSSVFQRVELSPTQRASDCRRFHRAQPVRTSK